MVGEGKNFILCRTKNHALRALTLNIWYPVKSKWNFLNIPHISLNCFRMVERVLFFDNNGVISDSNLAQDQWKRRIPDFFVPRFGGDPQKWMEGNIEAVRFLIAKIREDQENNIVLSQKEFDIYENKLWIEIMFDYVGIPYPPKSEYMNIQKQADAAIIPHIDPAYPGIKEAIRTLRKSFTLHTASNEYSTSLEMKFDSMDIRPHFDLLFGTDLVNTMKSNAEYYYKIFKYSNINPKNAVVIDDKPILLEYAQSTGAEVIQSCQDGQKPEFDLYFTEPQQMLDLTEN